MVFESRLPRKINSVVGERSTPGSILPIATGNQDKLKELRALGLQVDPRPSVKPKEIQGDPKEVLEEKAKDAYLQNGGPIMVEDTYFIFDHWGQLPGSYAKDFLAERSQREIFAASLPENDRGATFGVGLAVYDGQEVHMRIAEARGQIAKTPQGPSNFAFDDIFIPDGQKNPDGSPIAHPRTYAEMSLEEKNKTSARSRAYRLLVADPFIIDGQVFEMPEPTDFQISRIDKEAIVQHPDALRFGYALTPLEMGGIAPSSQLDVDIQKIPPIHRLEHANGAVLEYTFNPDSATSGAIILPEIDLKVGFTPKGEPKPIRLDVDVNGDPILHQMGPKGIEQAIASRAREFMDMHSPQMHEHIRQLVGGEIPHVARTNTPSPVLEEMIGMQRDAQGNIIRKSAEAIATKELGYKRQSYEGHLSRKEAAIYGTLILGPDGIPSSIFSLGGMPNVTGSRDVLVTAALSYMRSWIPHNGVFAGNFDKQLRLFTESRDQIRSLGLPKDIENICINQIGIAVGSEKPQEIADQIRQFQKAGGHAARIYTTNPDSRVVETAKAIREAVGEDFLICVGPVTDAKQAEKLHDEANVQMFLIGHGGGENCTSLAAGGAANSIEILYEMYLNPKFNNSLLGLEGGTGETIGALLPLIDVISLNQRGVGAGIEVTGGFYFQQTRNGSVRNALPYSGTASAFTQLVESYLDPTIAKRRLGADGRVRNVEGKPNYMIKRDAISSMVDQIAATRALAGLAIADQRSHSIYELRSNVLHNGHNHVEVTPESSAVAGEHRRGI